MVTISRSNDGQYLVSCWVCNRENLVANGSTTDDIKCTCGATIGFHAFRYSDTLNYPSTIGSIMSFTLQKESGEGGAVRTFANRDISNWDLSSFFLTGSPYGNVVRVSKLVEHLNDEQLSQLFRETRGVDTALFHSLPSVDKSLREKVLNAQKAFNVQPTEKTVPLAEEVFFTVVDTKFHPIAVVYVIKRLMADKPYCWVYEVVELANFEAGVNLVAKFQKPPKQGDTSIGQVSVLKDLHRLWMLNVKKTVPELDFSQEDLDFIPKVEAVGSVKCKHSYFVMEKVEGKTLEELIYTKYPDGMPPDVALRVTKAIASKLNYLHSMGYIHGDINPRNIILGYSEEKKESYVKLIDYSEMVPYRYINIERKLKSGIFYEAIKTSMWNWPEFGQGRRALAAVDLYPLGVCLQVMLLGKKALECELSGEGIVSIWDKYVSDNSLDQRLTDLIDGLRYGLQARTRFASAQSVLFRIDHAYRAFPDKLVPMTEKQKQALRKGYGANTIHNVRFDTSKGDPYLNFEAAGYVDILAVLSVRELSFINTRLAALKKKLKKNK